MAKLEYQTKTDQFLYHILKLLNLNSETVIEELLHALKIYFFKTKKLQMKQLIDQTQVVIRKYKTKGKTLTAKDVKGDSVKDYIHTDKAYKFMKSLRGSPPYF